MAFGHKWVLLNVFYAVAHIWMPTGLWVPVFCTDTEGSCVKLRPGHRLHSSKVLPPHSHSRPTPEKLWAADPTAGCPPFSKVLLAHNGESTSRTTRDTAGLVSSLQKHDINTDAGHSTHQPSQTLLMDDYKTSKQIDKCAAEQHTATVSPTHTWQLYKYRLAVFHLSKQIV